MTRRQQLTDCGEVVASERHAWNAPCGATAEVWMSVDGVQLCWVGSESKAETSSPPHHRRDE
jgi:hypothetical protein